MNAAYNNQVKQDKDTNKDNFKENVNILHFSISTNCFILQNLETLRHHYPVAI